jgi:hypothetical protein
MMCRGSCRKGEEIDEQAPDLVAGQRDQRVVGSAVCWVAVIMDKKRRPASS